MWRGKIERDHRIKRGKRRLSTFRGKLQIGLIE
jgi:hypothetical protein